MLAFFSTSKYCGENAQIFCVELNLGILYFLLIFLEIFVSSNSCSYQVPNAEQIILNVPLRIENNVLFEENTLKRGNYSSNSKFHHHHYHRHKNRRFKRDTVLKREFKPLRISLYFDPASINPLSIDKQIFINSTLLPQAIEFWEQALLVRPSLAPIRLSRKCKSNHYYLDISEVHPSCVEQCRTITNCGEVSIPDEHLFKCRYCALPNPLSCTSVGPEDGPGVEETDFLLYVSAVSSTRCQNQDTIAYAAHCQQEAELDRPIAGHVNICPSALSTHLHDQEILLSTIKHEILHALGFSAGLYAFFRDSNGLPRTKRNRYNRPISFNRERGYYDADESTILTFIRKDWWTAENRIAHQVHLMITERVTEEARRHFNCSTLEGAELENQGGDGTFLTHWEKRLFENEAMTGTHTQNPVYSRLTLALMEDSGWYKANYDVAETLHWGHELGCEFAQKSCGEWIKNRLERKLSTAPFCHDIKHDGRRSLATTRCTDQRDSLALCNLIPYQKALPIEYRNFERLQGVRPQGLRYYGGSVELADFCPYNQEFEWKSVNSSDRRDSRCELHGNGATSDSASLDLNSVLEIYGPESKCFDLGVSWRERRCGRVKTYTQFMAGCYEFQCKNGRVYLKVENSTNLYPCYYSGQLIFIRRIINGWLREGSIRCPSCQEICTREHFRQQKHFHFDTTTTTTIEIENKNFFIPELPFLINQERNKRKISAKISREEIVHNLQSNDASNEQTTNPNYPPWQCSPDDPEMWQKLLGDEEIGDLPLDEPCSAQIFYSFLKPVFILIFHLIWKNI